MTETPTPAALAALRDEVTEELHGVSYAEIIPCDTEYIDSVVEERLAARKHS